MVEEQIDGVPLLKVRLSITYIWQPHYDKSTQDKRMKKFRAYFGPTLNTHSDFS
jgi:hypothetical protein